MACSVQYIWHANSFSYNGITTQVAQIANNTSVSDSDVELLNCRDNIFEGNANITIPWNSASRKYYGGKLEVANLLTSGCQSGLTWDVLARVIISWKPQFKTKNGLTISGETFSAEWNTSYRNDMPVNRISDTYDSTHNNILYNILFEVPTDSEISPLIQREVDDYCASINDEFDHYTYTPYFYISKFCIVKNWGGSGCAGNYSYNCACDGGDCSDSRTSLDTQSIHFLFSDGVSNTSEMDVTFNLSDGATQEKAIKTYMNDTIYNQLNNLYNLNQGVMARCYFNGGVVRSACVVRVVGKVYGEAVALEPSITPPYVSLDLDIVAGHDVDILRAYFNPCSDKPYRIQEDLVAYIDGLKTGNTYSIGFDMYQVLPYKVVIENCTALTDFCCDSETPSDNDSIQYGGYVEPMIQAYGQTSSSGGGDVDITCICNALSNINDTLSAFKTANESVLGEINDTLSTLNIGVDNQCVCDNLEDVVDGLGAIKDSIDDKVLSVTNNNTVNPPVNNVAVNPPVNNVSVTVPTTELADISSKLNQLQTIAGHLNNNVVELGNIESDLKCNNNSIACIINGKNFSTAVNFDTSSIVSGLSGIENAIDDTTSELSGVADFCSATADALSCDNDSLACIVKNAFNTEKIVDGESVNKSITQILDEKDIADVNVETIVEPCDYTYTRGASRDLTE